MPSSEPTIVGPELRLSFSQTLPNFQFAWDSTSLGYAKACPRKYQYAIVLGYRHKRGKESLHLRYGSLYHRALEVYDHKVFEGMSHEDAIRFSIRDLAEGCMDTASDGTRTWWDPNANLSEEAAKKNTKTIPALFTSVVWYLEQFGPNDPAQTVRLKNGKPAVELSFRFDTGQMLHGEPIFFSGHLDRLVDFNGQQWVMDRKTTGTTISGASSFRYFEQFTPNNQMSLYSLASRIVLESSAAGVIIDAVQIAKGFSHFERGFAPRTERQLDEWFNDALMLIYQMGDYAKEGYWPTNDKSCGDYGGCPFRDICKKDPSVRHIFLQSDFVVDKWDPLKVRGEI